MFFFQPRMAITALPVFAVAFGQAVDLDWTALLKAAKVPEISFQRRVMRTLLSNVEMNRSG